MSALTATSLYALNLDQIEAAIAIGGHKRTVLVQGHMGTGKSSLLRALGKRFPNHVMCYFDCTTKDLGDITLPQLRTMDEEGCVRLVPTEELGLHLGKDVIIMIDEYGKANASVKNALLRLMLERKMGAYTLTESSLVFATTNLGAEGVGDLLPPHARNRISVVTSRKPTNIEWLEGWAIHNNVDVTVMGWVKDTPALFQSFEEITHPFDDSGNPTNPYIYHPAVPMTAFVTPRSLEAASDWIKVRDKLDAQTLTAMLMGTIGERAAMDLMAYVHIADQLPRLEDIKRDPMGAKVPDSAAAVCMVVWKVVQSLERDWVDAWMTYLTRLDKEAQGLFANAVRSPKYPKQAMVMTNKKFTEYALANNYQFTSRVK